MDFVRVYDIHTRARQRLFDAVRPLSQEQYTQAFPFGAKTLRATLTHMANAEWYLTMRLREEPLPPRSEWPHTEERRPTFADLERAWAVQAPVTRATLAALTGPDRVVETRIPGRGAVTVFTAALGDIATQLCLHEVHHRAQAMAMLRQLGVELQTIDFISFVQQRREEPA